jgi:hypothetical protein
MITSRIAKKQKKIAELACELDFSRRDAPAGRSIRSERQVIRKITRLRESIEATIASYSKPKASAPADCFVVDLSDADTQMMNVPAVASVEKTKKAPESDVPSRLVDVKDDHSSAVDAAVVTAKLDSSSADFKDNCGIESLTAESKQVAPDCDRLQNRSRNSTEDSARRVDRSTSRNHRASREQIGRYSNEGSRRDRDDKERDRKMEDRQDKGVNRRNSWEGDRRERDRHSKADSTDRNRSMRQVHSRSRSRGRDKVGYKDGGRHWCIFCSHEYDSISSFLSHLESTEHKQMASATNKKQEITKPVDVSKCRIIKIVKGSEFLTVVTEPMYCKLCHVFLADGQHATSHLLSTEHNTEYKRYTEKNVSYEFDFANLKSKVQEHSTDSKQGNSKRRSSGNDDNANAGKKKKSRRSLDSSDKKQSEKQKKEQETSHDTGKESTKTPQKEKTAKKSEPEVAVPAGTEPSKAAEPAVDHGAVNEDGQQVQQQGLSAEKTASLSTEVSASLEGKQNEMSDISSSESCHFANVIDTLSAATTDVINTAAVISVAGIFHQKENVAVPATAAADVAPGSLPSDAVMLGDEDTVEYLTDAGGIDIEGSSTIVGETIEGASTVSCSDSRQPVTLSENTVDIQQTDSVTELLRTGADDEQDQLIVFSDVSSTLPVHQTTSAEDHERQLGDVIVVDFGQAYAENGDHEQTVIDETAFDVWEVCRQIVHDLLAHIDVSAEEVNEHSSVANAGGQVASMNEIDMLYSEVSHVEQDTDEVATQNKNPPAKSVDHKPAASSLCVTKDGECVSELQQVTCVIDESSEQPDSAGEGAERSAGSGDGEEMPHGNPDETVSDCTTAIIDINGCHGNESVDEEQMLAVNMPPSGFSDAYGDEDNLVACLPSASDSTIVLELDEMTDQPTNGITDQQVVDEAGTPSLSGDLVGESCGTKDEVDIGGSVLDAVTNFEDYSLSSFNFVADEWSQSAERLLPATDEAVDLLSGNLQFQPAADFDTVDDSLASEEQCGIDPGCLYDECQSSVVDQPTCTGSAQSTTECDLVDEPVTEQEAATLYPQCDDVVCAEEEGEDLSSDIFGQQLASDRMQESPQSIQNPDQVSNVCSPLHDEVVLLTDNLSSEGDCECLPTSVDDLMGSLQHVSTDQDLDENDGCNVEPSCGDVSELPGVDGTLISLSTEAGNEYFGATDETYIATDNDDDVGSCVDDDDFEIEML